MADRQPREGIIARRRRLRLTDKAEADLSSIWSHVAADSSDERATRLIDRIALACRNLCLFPSSGPSRDGLSPGLRATFVGRYVVYYVHDDEEVAIVRVLHGARDIEALVGEGGFA